MINDKYARRDQLVQERDSLIGEMKGVRDHFVSTLADELPDRWDAISRTWVRLFHEEAKAAGSALTDLRENIADTLRPRAREIAEQHLSGPTIWSHEPSEDSSKWPNSYAHGGMTGEANVWFPVSRPVADAEDEVVSLLRAVFKTGHSTAHRKSRNASLSPPLVDIITVYAEQHERLKGIRKSLWSITREIGQDEAESLWDGPGNA